MSILAIDQGTTSTRALVLTNDGSAKLIHAVQHEQIYPQSGWVEHSAEELIQNITTCIEIAISWAVSQGEMITAMGIDNQGESCLAWDAKSKQAVSPVIVWQDNRTQSTIESLKNSGIEEEVLQKTGLPLDSYFSASKLAWILENIPEAKALHQKGQLRLGTTDAFFLDRLSGRFVTDISTASRTSLMDLRTGQWDEGLCQLFGVPITALPEIVPTTGDFGMVESNGQSIPLIASVVDQQASLYGHGCKTLGDTKITFGTGVFALAITGETPYQSAQQGLLPTVAWQLGNNKPIYALDGGVYSAGSAINWAKNKLGLFDSFEEINQFDQPSAIERDLVFVPALTGLACPHWDRRAGGLWIGLSLDTDKKDMMQSMLEGIAFRTAEVVEAMHQLTPIKNSISIDGGLSANPYFCQFLADVLQREIVVQAFAETTALGTALLVSHEANTNNTRPGRQYLAMCDRQSQLGKFKEAVKRSANWR